MEEKKSKLTRPEAQKIALENKEEIIKLYLSGMGTRKINAKFGIACSKNLLIKNNIEIRKPIPRFTKEEINLKIKENLVEMVDEYTNISTSTNFRCLKEGCGHIWISTAKRILKGRSCLKCLGLDPWTNSQVDQILVENKRTIIRLGNVLNSRTNLDWQCKVCQHSWANSIDNVINKEQNCAVCAQVSPLTDLIIDQRLLGTSLKRMDSYPGSQSSKINFKCLICDYVFLSRVNNVLSGNTVCHQCHGSRGERLVLMGLRVNQIFFYQHYTIKNIFQQDLPKRYVDFYLPDLNTIIEYNGIQHYQPVKFGSQTQEDSLKSFAKQQERDLYIDQLCRQNKVNLIWIDGREYYGNKLKEYLKKEIIPMLNSGHNLLSDQI